MSIIIYGCVCDVIFLCNSTFTQEKTVNVNFLLKEMLSNCEYRKEVVKEEKYHIVFYLDRSQVT